ncbi:MAG TPA: glycosyltransferase family 39 protein, partial [Methylomirabilota bacterium]|nr:glycosyltransferase family 39 protein [Methylomirabilota bacterium]
MSSERPRTQLYLMALVVFWALVYGGSLFQPALLDDADSVHAEAAKEMLARHDWVTLYVNGIRYLEKAPLMYWGMAASFKMFGFRDWAARLPLALGVLGLILAVFGFGRRHFGETSGFYSALAAGFAFGPYLFTRFLIPDVFVALWLVLALDFFLRTLDEPHPSLANCWGLGAACALNVLTKGLIGLIFPLAAIGLFLLLTGNLKHLLRMRILSSTAVFLAIAAPWHILAGLRNPTQGNVRGFFWFYLVNEHFLRFLGRRLPRDYGTVPLALFWGLILVWLFPWTSFLPQALGRVALFRPREAARTPAGRAALVLFFASLFIVFFFSFSTRQEYYVIPALPPLALLVGDWLAEERRAPSESALHRSALISARVLGVIGAAAGAAALFIAARVPSAPPGADIAELLRAAPRESAQYALSLGHFLDLNLRVMGLFRGQLVLFGLALLLGSVLHWFFRARRKPALGNVTLAAMTGFLLLAVHQGLVGFSPMLTSKQLADAIQRVYKAGDIIEINGEFEGASTLTYYTGVPSRILNGRSANLWYGSQFPDAPQIFDDNTAFQKL